MFGGFGWALIVDSDSAVNFMIIDYFTSQVCVNCTKLIITSLKNVVRSSQSIKANTEKMMELF